MIRQDRLKNKKVLTSQRNHLADKDLSGRYKSRTCDPQRVILVL